MTTPTTPEDAAALSAPTGGSPEHLLQDQDRGLSRWLADKPDARLHAREAAAAIVAPADVPALPAAPVQPVAQEPAGWLEGQHGAFRAALSAPAAPSVPALTPDQRRALLLMLDHFGDDYRVQCLRPLVAVPQPGAPTQGDA